MPSPDTLRALIRKLEDAATERPEHAHDQGLAGPSMKDAAEPSERSETLNLIRLKAACDELAKVARGHLPLPPAILEGVTKLIPGSRPRLYIRSSASHFERAAPPSDAEQRERERADTVENLALEHLAGHPISNDAAHPNLDIMLLGVERSGEAQPERRRARRPPAAGLRGALVINPAAHLTPPQRLSLEVYASQATSALEQGAAWELAATDRLTGALTRAQLSRALKAEFEAFEERDAPFSLLLLDLDDFAETVEDLGQRATNDLLRRLSKALRQQLRAEDSLFRFGSESFAVLLPETQKDGCSVVVDRLLTATLELPLSAETPALSACIGFAECPDHERTSPARLIARADQALASAKASGRGRAACWSPRSSGQGPRHDPLAGILSGEFAKDYRRVRLLLETFQGLVEARDPHTLQSFAVEQVIAATSADRGALLLLDAAGQLRAVIAKGRARQALDLSERFSASVPERALRSGVALCVTIEDAPADSLGESFAELELKTVMCAPLRGPDGPLGVLYVDGGARSSRVREELLPFFAALANYIAGAVDNHTLHTRLRDPRSGVARGEP